MAIPQQTRLYSLSEFEVLLERPENAERLLELIDGELYEKVPTFEHGMIAGNLIEAINRYTKPRKLGRAAVEGRYQLPADQQSPERPHSRLPDVSYISRERGLPLVTQGAVPAMPDLAIEIQSPDQDDAVMSKTADYYLAHGARMVLLVYPNRKIVEKLPGGALRLHTLDDVIDLDPVIPGLTIPVREIFQDPLEDV